MKSLIVMICIRLIINESSVITGVRVCPLFIDLRVKCLIVNISFCVSTPPRDCRCKLQFVLRPSNSTISQHHVIVSYALFVVEREGSRVV